MHRQLACGWPLLDGNRFVGKMGFEPLEACVYVLSWTCTSLSCAGWLCQEHVPLHPGGRHAFGLLLPLSVSGTGQVGARRDGLSVRFAASLPGSPSACVSQCGGLCFVAEPWEGI